MRWLFLFVIGFLLGSGPLAEAQRSDQSESPSRAALLEAQRQARVATVSPPQKSGIERALDWYDNQYGLTKVLSGWHGLRLAGGSFPAGAGPEMIDFEIGKTFDYLQNTFSDPEGPDGPALNINTLDGRFIPGTPVGEFRYFGTRSDDPNDLFPHERRRELHGMRVFAAWLNHDDARSINSFDAYIEDGGRHYIRHSLLDFGCNLGSGSTSAQQPRGGYEYLIEGQSIVKGLATLGFWQRGWTQVTYPDYPAVGNVEADFFEPWTWKTEYPQPAVARMDAADAFWAASIAAKFSDETIRAIVRTGQISDASAETYLADTIITRRNSEHADFPQWRAPVEVALRRRAERVEVVGILRPR